MHAHIFLCFLCQCTQASLRALEDAELSKREIAQKVDVASAAKAKILVDEAMATARADQIASQQAIAELQKKLSEVIFVEPTCCIRSVSHFG